MSRQPSNEYMCVCVGVGNSPAFRWRCWNGSISACATVRVCCASCLLPPVAKQKTHWHFSACYACCFNCLLQSHTHQNTHKHAHASVHCIMALSLSILLLRCTVSSVHSRPKRKNETETNEKNQNENDNICCRLLGECACLCTYVPHFNGLNCSTHSNGHACKLAAGESVSKCCHSPNCSRETGDKAYCQKCCILLG